MTFDPAGLILRSFNALDPVVAADPLNVVAHLQDHRRTAPAVAAIPGTGTYRCELSIWNMYEHSLTAFAAAAGWPTDFDRFSGSVQFHGLDSATHPYRAYAGLHLSRIDHGGHTCVDPTDQDAISNALDPILMQRLNAVANMRDAAAFVADYGTHLVTAVDCGGLMATLFRATIATEADRSMIHEAIVAGIGAANSGADAVRAGQQLADRFGDLAFGSTIFTSHDALGVVTPSFESIDAWAASCTDRTFASIRSTLAFWQLAAPSASRILEFFDNGSLLAASLSAPTVFSNTVAITPNSETSGQVVPDAGYQTIGGGAAVTDGSVNFLTSCCPTIVQDPNPRVGGWTAASHDLDQPAGQADELTVYCIAANDPGGLLEIQVQSWPRFGAGVQSAPGALDDYPRPWTLTGGGPQTLSQDGVQKFIIGSWPIPTQPSPAWTSTVTDYESAANATALNAMGMGVQSGVLIVTSSVVTDSESHVLNGNIGVPIMKPIAGGGVNLTNINGSANLLQQCYPIDAYTWMTGNKSLDGSTTADVETFAITLAATVDPDAMPPARTDAGG